MFNNSHDNFVIEEIIKKNWPNLGTDTAAQDDSDWEILNDTTSNDAIGRHWFKQNYVNQMPQHTSSVMYH